jgi:anti-sigma factor RsiW
MSCSPYELKDYFFGELSEAESLAMRAHLETCPACRGELDRLRTTQAALRLSPEEEVPRRIALVSDKVFDTPWWRRLWQPAPHWGFASAMVLALAIVFHAVYRPVAAPAADTAALQARISAEFAARLQPAVQAAVAESEARQVRNTAQLVEAARKDLDFERRADNLQYRELAEILLKKYNSWMRASANLGGQP